MKLSFSAILSLVIGAQIGSAIFMLPSKLCSYGIYAIYGWIISGIGALSIAFVFSRLASIFPDGGGPPLYIRKSFGDLLGFISIWTYWIISWFSTAPVVITIGINLAQVFGFSNLLFVEILCLTIFTLLNCYSINAVSRTEIVLTILKIVPLVILPLVFLLCGENYIHEYTNGSSKSIQLASTTTIWGFIGLEVATTPANRAKNKSDISKALILGSIIVSLVYIINTYSIFYSLPYNELSNTNFPYSLAMTKCLGGSYGNIVAIIISIVCMGTLNSWILATGQMSSGASRMGLFPSFFSKEKNQVPIYGIIVQYILILITLILMSDSNINNQISYMIDVSVTAYIMLFALSIFSFLKCKLCKLDYIISLFALLFCIWIFIGTDFNTLIQSLLIPLSGLIIRIIFNTIRL